MDRIAKAKNLSKAETLKLAATLLVEAVAAEEREERKEGEKKRTRDVRPLPSSDLRHKLNQQKKPRKKPPKKEKRFCFHCRKQGHESRQCYRLRSEVAGGK